MDTRDWSKFLFPYEQAVEELKVKFKTMRTELKKRAEYAPIEFVTGRVKRISSILEKAKKLNIPLDRLEQGIEDIAGIRIMCQFVEDIHVVANYIRDRKDLILIYEKDYVKHYKESGYRSYHMIIEYPVQTALGLVPVLAEIQIRTLAMNFWATIEHSLNYKYRGSLPPQMRERLKRASEAAFALDTEMSSIRQEIIDSQKKFEENTNMTSRILSGIQELYSHHRIREAIQLQLRFNEIWEQEGSQEHVQLYQEVLEAIGRAKKGSLSDEV